MAVVWPSKSNFANGDVLTATNMNNIGDTLNVFNPTSATNGQVWTANGTGGGSYLSPSGSITQLATAAMNGTTITISSISGSYKQLWLHMVDCLSNNGTVTIRYNNDSGTNYSWLAANDISALFTSSTNATGIRIDTIQLKSTGGRTFDLVVPGYAESKYHTTYFYSGGTANADADEHTTLGSGFWLSATAVNRIDIIASVTLTGTYYLYGIN